MDFFIEPENLGICLDEVRDEAAKYENWNCFPTIHEHYAIQMKDILPHKLF